MDWNLGVDWNLGMELVPHSRCAPQARTAFPRSDHGMEDADAGLRLSQAHISVGL